MIPDYVFHFVFLNLSTDQFIIIHTIAKKNVPKYQTTEPNKIEYFGVFVAPYDICDVV